MPPMDRDLTPLYWPNKGLDAILPSSEAEALEDEFDEALEEREREADAQPEAEAALDAEPLGEIGEGAGPEPDGNDTIASPDVPSAERLTPEIWAARPGAAPAAWRAGAATATPPGRRPGARGRPGRGNGQGVDLTTIAKHSYTQFSGAIVNAFLSLGLIVLAAHSLGKGGTGALYVGIAMFMIVSNLAELGADTGLVRMIPHLRANGRIKDLRRVLAISVIPVFVIGLILTVPLLLYAPQLANLLSHNRNPERILPYLRIFALFLSLSCVSAVALAGARGFGSVLAFVSVENIGKPVARPILLYLAVAFGLGTTAVAMSWALPIAAGALVAVAWLMRKLRDTERRARDMARPSLPPTPMGKLALEFWRFASPRSLMGFFSTIVTWLDTLLLAAMLSPGDAGVYTAATRLTFPGIMALQAIILVISPQISRFMAKEETKKDAREVYQTATWWLVAVTWPFFLTLAVFAPLILSVFGQKFVVGSTVTVILALSSLANMATGPIGAVILMSGRSLVGLFVSVGALTLNVVLNLLLIPRYGIEGSAIAWGASILFNNVIGFIYAYRSLKIGPLGKGFSLVSISSLMIYGGLGLATRHFFGTSVLAFVGCTVVSTALYAAVLFRFRGILKLAALRAALPFGRRRHRRAYEAGGSHGAPRTGGRQAGAQAPA